MTKNVNTEVSNSYSERFHVTMTPEQFSLWNNLCRAFPGSKSRIVLQLIDHLIHLEPQYQRILLMPDLSDPSANTHYVSRILDPQLTPAPGSKASDRVIRPRRSAG